MSARFRHTGKVGYQYHYWTSQHVCAGCDAKRCEHINPRNQTRCAQARASSSRYCERHVNVPRPTRV